MREHNVFTPNPDVTTIHAPRARNRRRAQYLHRLFRSNGASIPLDACGYMVQLGWILPRNN